MEGRQCLGSLENDAQQEASKANIRCSLVFVSFILAMSYHTAVALNAPTAVAVSFGIWGLYCTPTFCSESCSVGTAQPSSVCLLLREPCSKENQIGGAGGCYGA